MEMYGSAPPASGTVQGYGSTTGSTVTEVIPSQGPGFCLQISGVVIDNSHATTKTGVNLYSGSTKIFGPIPAPAAGGAILVPLIPPLRCADNEAFGFAPLASVTTISVSAIGYKAVRP